MTNEEYFINWAKEYEESVNALTEHIAQLREEAKKVKLSERIEFDERIKMLSQMKVDCESTRKALTGRAAYERSRARRKAVAI